MLSSLGKRQGPWPRRQVPCTGRGRIVEWRCSLGCLSFKDSIFDKGPVLLPCQLKYWHHAKNRLRDKTGFEIYNPQNVEKSGFGQSVCVSVCPSVCLTVCLAVAFPASSHRRNA